MIFLTRILPDPGDPAPLLLLADPDLPGQRSRLQSAAREHRLQDRLQHYLK